MSRIEDVKNQIDIDRNHIDSFVLETNEGTKRTKDKFFRNASAQRNEYVNRELNIFEGYLNRIKDEMRLRIQRLTPVDKTNEYAVGLLEVDHLLDLVKLNANISNSFKLGISFIIASIDENTSLEKMNSILKEFVDKFRSFGISLTITDFQYTMFTEQYMSAFFQNPDPVFMKDAFEKIYFACPDIKLHLKMNLEYIVEKYAKELDRYVTTFKQTEFSNYSVNEFTVVDKYITTRYNVGNKMAIDEYYNSKLFLEGKRKISDYLENSAARTKNYDTFVVNGKYQDLDEESKNAYDSAIMGFYLTLNELKKYYKYEFILKDLLERYKNKDSAKTQFINKKKEIEKEDKNRQAIYKEYLKAMGIGFLARKNEVAMKNAMLKMNEMIKKLHTLYEELNDIEITNYLSEVSESASIYDLFMASLRSFAFLEKSFLQQEAFQEVPFKSVIDDYLKFLYNPNNTILRKINVFTDYDIVSIVAEKYRLLNLKVTNDMIGVDAIDTTLDSVQFINLIQNISRSHITLHDIENICKMRELCDYQEGEETE